MFYHRVYVLYSLSILTTCICIDRSDNSPMRRMTMTVAAATLAASAMKVGVISS